MDNTQLKLPPQNLDAERAVIGSILIDDDVFLKISEILKSDMFYDPKHKIIFQHIEQLVSANSPIDIVTLTDVLKKSKKYKMSGGAVYLSEIVAEIPTAANITSYAEIVREKSIRRRLINFGGELAELARNEEKSIDEITNQIEKQAVGVSQNSGKTDFFTSAELLEQQIARVDEYAKNPDGIRGIPTGINGLDKILGGLHKSDLIIVAARPGVGKSAISLSMARHAAVYAKKTVAIFSLEMPGIQLIERILAQETQIDLWNLRMGRLTDEEFTRLSVAQGRLAEANILVDETSGINIMQLRSKVRKLVMDRGLDLIIIDYLQLMQGSGVDNRAQEIGEISRSMKILARELHIPVIALSQLNRAVENRVDAVPQLSDLRESGSIEQDADIVMFLSRKMSTEDDSMNDAVKKVDIHIAKHRNGAIGKVSVEFIAAQQRYVDIEE